MCCGPAGIYSLTEPEMARRLLERTVRPIEATVAEVVVTANPGGILPIAAGLRHRGLPTRVAHIGEVLDQAYAAVGDSA